RPHVRDDLGSRLLETIHVRDPILLYPRVRDDCWADDWDARFGSLLESARSVARKGTCAIVESRGSFQNGMSLGSNSACHGQATAHSTPCPLPRDCWTPACPPVTERPERGAVEEGPIRCPLQACIAHHWSARPYAGAGRPRGAGGIKIRLPRRTFI